MQLIPEDFEYSCEGDPCYVSQDEMQKITEGADVRLRIVGTKMDHSEIVGTHAYNTRPDPIEYHMRHIIK